MSPLDYLTGISNLCPKWSTWIKYSNLDLPPPLPFSVNGTTLYYPVAQARNHIWFSSCTQSIRNSIFFYCLCHHPSPLDHCKSSNWSLFSVVHFQTKALQGSELYLLLQPYLKVFSSYSLYSSYTGFLSVPQITTLFCFGAIVLTFLFTENALPPVLCKCAGKQMLNILQKLREHGI